MYVFDLFTQSFVLFCCWGFTFALRCIEIQHNLCLSSEDFIQERSLLPFRKNVCPEGFLSLCH